MANVLTEEEFKAALPPSVRKSVSNDLISGINKVLSDPNSLDFLKENILGYTSVMQDGRFKMISYLNAVHYVSYKLFGSTNIDAYIKTFPAKYKKFLATGVSAKDISSYASAYNKSKLVTLIFEQTLVPTYILNAPMYQEALNVQAELMLNARSEKVRSDAANSILTHLKRPETQKVELDIGVKQDASMIADLREATAKLAEQQRLSVSSGTVSAKQLAETPLDVEVSSE